MPAPSILAISGSIRRDSINMKLLRVAARAAEAAGAAVTIPDLASMDLPIYNGDDEAARGIPEGAKQLKELFKAHQGLLFACPEYNSSITPFLKNVIDWVSRPVPNEKPLECFNGKTCALLSASQGSLGGLRGLVTVRSILSNIGVIVLPDQYALTKAEDALGPDGVLKSDADKSRLKVVVERLVNITAALNS